MEGVAFFKGPPPYISLGGLRVKTFYQFNFMVNHDAIYNFNVIY